MKNINVILAFLVLIALIFSGCTLDAPTEKQTVLSLGSANFASYVAIGNSLTAGYQSGALTEKHQIHSFPNLIAQQADVSTFVQPLIGYPGIGAFTAGGAGIYELVFLDDPTNPGSPKLEPAKYSDWPNFNPSNPYLNSTVMNHPAPYNNLGVPGAVTVDVMNATDHTNSGGGFTNNTMFDVILRNPTLGNTTQFQQAKMLQASFITCWIGNNDVLGYATSGGTSPPAPTDVPTFTFLYSQMLDSLVATGAQIVLANIPDVTAIPYFTTIPYMVDVPGVGLVPLQIQTATTSRVATATDLILLPASSVIGDTSGAYGPQGVPVGLHPLAPLPNSLVLDSDEVTIALTAVSDFNGVIANLAGAANVAVVDMNSIFNDISTNGYSVAGQEFSADFIKGGLFSYDGVHPSNTGHAVVANEFIKVINDKYGASIPMVNVIEVTSLSKLSKNTNDIIFPSPEAFKPVIRAVGGFID
jgi:GDSL-like lipase/acylhydrolase family protein